MKSFATRKFRTTRGQKTFLWGTHTYWGLGDQREKTTKVKVALFQRKVASNARKLAILIWTAYISDLIRRHECNTIWCQILRQRCHITRHCNTTRFPKGRVQRQSSWSLAHEILNTLLMLTSRTDEFIRRTFCFATLLNWKEVWTSSGSSERTAKRNST